MVTTGVYLLDRTHAIFEAAPDVQMLAAILGTLTLLVAGIVALVQTDIKQVIAYSTMSQIGYMFLGAGVGAYAAAIFLLAMHAFFKALLFMGAGIVIHYLSGEQDMRKMGGLKDRLPKTWLAFLIRVAGARGRPDLRGLLGEGPDRRRPRLWRALDRARHRGCRRSVPVWPLHVPDVLPRLVRRAVAGGACGGRAPTRGGRCRPGRVRLAGGGSRGPLHHRRLPTGAGRVGTCQRLARSGRRAAVHPPASFDWLTSVVVVPVGLAGTYVAYLIYEAHGREVRTGPGSSARSSTSSGSTSSTTRSSPGRPK